MKGLADKLWLSSSDFPGRHRAYYVPFQSSQREGAWWLDSFLVNSRLPESFVHIKTAHRIPSYVAKIKALAKEMSQHSAHEENSVAAKLDTKDKVMAPSTKAVRGSERLQ